MPPALMLVTAIYTGIVSFVPYKEGSQDHYAVLVQDATTPPMGEGDAHVATIRFPRHNYVRHVGNLLPVPDPAGELQAFDLRGFDVVFDRGSTTLQQDPDLRTKVLVIEEGCLQPGCGKFKALGLHPAQPIDPSLAARTWVTTGRLTAKMDCPVGRFENTMDPSNPMNQEVRNEFMISQMAEYKVTLKKGSVIVGVITLQPYQGGIEITISNTLPEERLGVELGTHTMLGLDEHVKLYYTMAHVPVAYADRKGLVIEDACPMVKTPNGANCPPGFWDLRP